MYPFYTEFQETNVLVFSTPVSLPKVLAMSTSDEPTITLYTTQTPNGIKISITLEELG